jgi:hypothetical protein
MSLEQASLISQIVSALAVVASLIFVGFQMLQNTKAVKASTSQAHSANYLQAVSSLYDNAEVARLWRLGLADLDSRTEDERVRFLAFTSALFRFYEGSHIQWRRGQLDKQHWHTIEQQVISLAAQPGIRSWWKLRRNWHSPEFQDWFESLTPASAAALYHIPSDDPRPAATKRATVDSPPHY